MNRDIISVIEHTLLRADASYTDIERVSKEALGFGFRSVCINPCYVSFARDMLRGSNIKVVTVIGFPLGATTTEVKVYEAIQAGLLGADEIDIVMNIGLAKSGDWGGVERDLSDIIMATKGLTHKAIIECCFLTDSEKAKATEAAINAGAEFIKTSTGFGTKGATPQDIRLIKSISKGRAGIKAAGGIKTLSDALLMLDAGASLIGTSNAVGIAQEALTH